MDKAEAKKQLPEMPLMDSSLLRNSTPFTLGPLPNLLNKTQKCRHSLSSLSLPTNSHKHLFMRRSGSSSGPRNDVTFDEAAYEAERLSFDAKAREEMAETSKIETQESGVAEDPKAWKWVIRKRIWDMMEARNIAQNPRPVHHRIPNFVGAAAAADKVRALCNFF